MAVLRVIIPEPDRHARALATWGGLSVLGATVGILLSGVVTTWVSWRWMFAVPLLISAAALLLARRWLPATAPGERTALDLPGAALATAGITLVSYGLVMTGGHGWSSVRVLGPLVIGVTVLVAFGPAESRRRDPLLPLWFLADRRRITALAAIAMSAAGTTALYLFISLYLQQVRGWTPLRTSVAFAPCAVSLIAAGRFAGRCIARLGARTAVIAGLVLAATGLLLLARLGPHTAYAVGLLPGTVLMPAGVALTFAGAAVLAAAGVPPQQAGLAGGVMNMAMELGPTAGLALLVTVATARAAYAAHAAAGGAGRHAVAGAASPHAATVSGYAWAFGAAGVAFALLALLTVIAIPQQHPQESL